MHPVLSHRGGLRLYLAAWVLVSGLLAALLMVPGGMSPADSLALAVPLALLYGFLCLTAWYLCRYFPLQKTRLVPLLIIHIGASVLTSMLWIALGLGWASALSRLHALEGIGRRFSAHVPLLFGIGVVLFALAVAAHYLMAAFETSRAAEKQVLEMKVLAGEAELRVLKSQVDPHFLFNSLNSISALIPSDPAGARRMTLQLSDFLRSSLRTSNLSSIALEDEISLVSSFLSIEQVRFGPRLKVDQQIEESSRRCRVPPLLLQPLVENAVKHGIARLLEGGTVLVRAERTGDRLKILVRNPMDPETTNRRRRGFGLANVRSRLASVHGQDARLRVSDNADTFTAEIVMPAVLDPADAGASRPWVSSGEAD